GDEHTDAPLHLRPSDTVTHRSPVPPTHVWLREQRSFSDGDVTHLGSTLQHKSGFRPRLPGVPALLHVGFQGIRETGAATKIQRVAQPTTSTIPAPARRSRRAL